MMKSLFNENHRFTDEAITLDREVHAALKPIVNKAVENGFSPREISHIIMLYAMETEMETILTENDKRHRKLDEILSKEEKK